MCVAVTLDKGAELTHEEIFKMGNANGDGFGIAWADDGVVHWWKTLAYDVDYLTHTVNTLSLFPRFVHFRLTTMGGTRVDLCHPFEIGPFASCAAQGHGQKVMMHNGHWGQSKDFYAILKENGALPDDGPWSDTRLAAFLASKDEDWLTVVTGRVATLDGAGNMKLIGHWDKLRDGIMVSNKVWDHNYNYQRTGRTRWEGWGWSEENWKAKEAHDRAKKEAAEKEAAKDGEKEKGPISHVAGGNLGVRRHDRQLLASGEHGGPAHQGGGAGVKEGAKEGGQAEQANEGKKARKRVYDLRPWFDSTSGYWYQVDPNQPEHSDGTPRTRKISEAEARSFLEQIAAASREGGTA